MKNLLLITVMFISTSTLIAQNYCPSGGGTTSGDPGNSPTQDFTSGSNSSLGSISGSSAFSHLLNQTNSNLTTRQVNQLVYEEIDGSPYLNDTPSKGTLVLNNGSMVEDILLQMDLHTNQAIATLQNGDEVFLDSKYFQEIVIPHDGKDVVFKKINPKNPDMFYEVLFEDGDTKFFKERYATISEPYNNGKVKRDAKLTQRTKYFIHHGEGEIAKVKLKQKDIFSKFLNDEVYAMEQYAQEKGIKFRNEGDYIEVFSAVAANDDDE